LSLERHPRGLEAARRECPGASLLSREASDSVVPIRSQLDPSVQSRARRVLGFDEDHTSILRSAEVAQALREFLAPLASGVR